MEPQNNNLDFVLHANDACTPAAINAYADACDQHGATAVAQQARDQANAVLNYQQQNGSVIPTVEQQPPVDNPPADNSGTGEQQPPVENPPADNTGSDQPPAPATESIEFSLDEVDAEIADGKITVTKKAV